MGYQRCADLCDYYGWERSWFPSAYNMWYSNCTIFLTSSSPRVQSKTIRKWDCGWVYFCGGSTPQSSSCGKHFPPAYDSNAHHTYIINVVPIVRQPDQCSQPEGHPDFTTHIVIIQWFVVPISVSEQHTAHVIISMIK